MIGKVLFNYQGRRVEAVLHNDGHWSCALLPCLVRPLDILHGPRWRGRSAVGPFGRECLEAAANWLNGCVVWCPSNSPDPVDQTAALPMSDDSSWFDVAETGASSSS